MQNLGKTLYTILCNFLSQQQAGLALGITFGIREYIDKTLTQSIKIVGVSHMIVLSGANISLFMNFVESSLFFIPKKLRVLLGIVITIIFISLIPIQGSVIRAAIMNIIPRIGDIIGRRVHRLYLLFLSCLMILAYDSKYISDISFQLSFLAVFGILIFSKDSDNVNTTPNPVALVTKYIKEQIYTCLSAQAFTGPLIFYYFGTISLLSLVAGILLSFTITPIMISSIFLAITQMFSYHIALIFASIINISTSYMVFIINFLAKLQFLYIIY